MASQSRKKNVSATKQARRKLIDYIHQAGKTANTRLRALEREGLTQSTPAYRVLEREAKDGEYWTSHTKKGEIKFKTATRNMSWQELEKMASKIRKFLSGRTTVTGSREKYREAYKTYKEAHPEINISKEEFNEYMMVGIFQNFKKVYGSSELVKLQERTAGSLTLDEVEELLRQAGFTEYSTEDDAPSLGSVYDAIEKYEMNKYAGDFNFDPNATERNPFEVNPL